MRWGQVRRLLCATVVVAILAACAPSPAVPPTAIPPTAAPSPAVTPTAPAPAQSATPTPRPDGLSPEQAATLASLAKVDDYPLYTMRYDSMVRSSDFSRLSQSPTTEVVTTSPAWVNSLMVRSNGFSRPWASPTTEVVTTNPAWVSSLMVRSNGFSRPWASPTTEVVTTSPAWVNSLMVRSNGFSRPWTSRTTEVVTTSPAWACSLFAALGNAENRLYGRNFDWDFSPALLLFYDTPDGYASASMVDIAYFGFSDRSVDLTKLPLAGRRALLETPFWPFDGMNEAGVAIGMAALPQAQAPYVPGKPYIGSLRLIREILDHAATVDEAVAIIGSYNLGWEGGPPLHYLIADKSGRAALVEFYNGQTIVRPNEGAWHAATNFTRSAVAGDAAGQCWRYDSLVRRLMDSGGRLAVGEALGLLQTVAQPGTQWSVVYGMSTGTVEVVMGRRYNQTYTFKLSAEGVLSR